MPLQAPQMNVLGLDVQIGADDGFEVLRQIRESSGVPVIMLTARASEDDKVRGLELGADDYVTKPFSYRELIARIRTHIERRRKIEDDPTDPRILHTVPGVGVMLRPRQPADPGQMPSAGTQPD